MALKVGDVIENPDFVNLESGWWIGDFLSEERAWKILFAVCPEVKLSGVSLAEAYEKKNWPSGTAVVVKVARSGSSAIYKPAWVPEHLKETPFQMIASHLSSKEDGEG